MTPTQAQISMTDVIAQCRAYRDAAHERGDSGVAREWQLVWLSLNELTAAATQTHALLAALEQIADFGTYTDRGNPVVTNEAKIARAAIESFGTNPRRPEPNSGPDGAKAFAGVGTAAAEVGGGGVGSFPEDDPRLGAWHRAVDPDQQEPDAEVGYIKTKTIYSKAHNRLMKTAEVGMETINTKPPTYKRGITGLPELTALDNRPAAAAEVGDTPLQASMKEVMAASERSFQRGVAATIERCAEVADSMAATPGYKVAAAIRALKD
jgi:hypothetical protein